MNSQIMQQLRDLPSFCAALYELTKSTSMGADDGQLDKHTSDKHTSDKHTVL
jgi:hypothetical protein